MGMKKALKELATTAMGAYKILTSPFPLNVNTKQAAIKTVDLRIDLHKHPDDDDKVTAIVQVNTECQDQGVKQFKNSGNKGGSGTHKGTHKVVAKIEYSRKDLVLEELFEKVENS